MRDGDSRRLGPVPDDLLSGRAGAAVDLAHLFASRRAHLGAQLPELRKALRPDAANRLSWPRNAAGVPGDSTGEVIREFALPPGLVDIEACVASEVGSGRKRVPRRMLRRPPSAVAAGAA